MKNIFTSLTDLYAVIVFSARKQQRELAEAKAKIESLQTECNLARFENGAVRAERASVQDANAALHKRIHRETERADMLYDAYCKQRDDYNELRSKFVRVDEQLRELQR